MASLLAVCPNLRDLLEILLRLDDRERMTKAFVLDDGRVRDLLVFAEDAVGKRVFLPTYLELAVGVVVQLDVLAC